MTEYNNVNFQLTNTQFDILKSGTRYANGVTIRFPSNPHKLSLL